MDVEETVYATLIQFVFSGFLFKIRENFSQSLQSSLSFQNSELTLQPGPKASAHLAYFIHVPAQCFFSEPVQNVHEVIR